MRRKDEMNSNKFLIEVKPDDWSCDPDHTRESREFYSKYWGKTLSNEISDYNGSLKKYRGDTIISFNTMTRCMISLLPIYKAGDLVLSTTNQKALLDIILQSDDVSNNLKEKFEKFHTLYHCLANFMPLVHDRWIPDHPQFTDLKNLNQAKGSYSKYNDFPDLFFSDIRRFGFSENPYNEKDKKENAVYFTETNGIYFERFNSWNKFVERNYLQDFFQDPEFTSAVSLAPSKEFFKNYIYSDLSKLPEKEKKERIEQISIFLTTAITIITARAERLYQLENNASFIRS